MRNVIKKEDVITASLGRGEKKLGDTINRTMGGMASLREENAAREGREMNGMEKLTLLLTFALTRAP